MAIVKNHVRRIRGDVRQGIRSEGIGSGAGYGIKIAGSLKARAALCEEKVLLKGQVDCKYILANIPT
jgi:hypothetical protein